MFCKLFFEINKISVQNLADFFFCFIFALILRKGLHQTNRKSCFLCARLQYLKTDLRNILTCK